MNLLEALRLCKAGHKVRPACWRTLNPYHWVEARIIRGGLYAFFECNQEVGCREFVPMAHEAEFLGEWEVLE